MTSTSGFTAGLPGRRTRSPHSVSAARHLPAFRPFQLATLSETIPKGPDWLFEMKFDGYRSQIAIAGSDVRIYTRRGHDWTKQFRVLVPTLASLTKGTALIDGEIVAIDARGRTNFSMLKTGIAAGIPLKFYAFDLLEQDGENLAQLPLLERKQRLEALIGDRDPAEVVQFSHHLVDAGKAVFDAMCAGGHEGMIAKRAGARYVGDRTKGWLKVKCTKRQEFVIGGWRPSENGRGMASLILGTFEDGTFVYRGRVGTGFSDAMRGKILAQLEERRLQKPAFASVPRDIARKANWARPELVAEVAYAEITPDGSLRHASFQGMREDKRAEDVMLEVPDRPPGEDVAVPYLDAAMGIDVAKALGVPLSHPDKILYLGTSISKAHLAAYYAAVADRMLPHLIDRPISLVRDTDANLDKTFFQKHALPGMPKAIHAGELTKLSGKNSQILWIDGLAGLIAGVQMNALEFHVWGSSRHEPDLPHRMVFDIDPDEELGFDAVKLAANDIRDILSSIGLKSWPLLSGGKGVHVVVPISPEVAWPEVKAFCQDFAEMLAKMDSTRFIANMSKARRKGRMFIDYLRNGQGATAICPWSTRAREGGTVAVPVSWIELEKIDRANAFDIFSAAKRAQQADPWTGYFDVSQVLTERVRNAVRLVSLS